MGRGDIADSFRTPRRNGFLVRMSQAMVDFFERWFPDAYVFVLLASIVVALATFAHGGGVNQR